MDNKGNYNINSSDAANCPFLSGTQKKTAGGGTSNRDWWPNEFEVKYSTSKCTKKQPNGR